MNGKWKRAAVYTAVALLLTACAGGGQDTESSAAAEEKVIRIGCEATTPGWIQTDENGNLTGYDYDVWMEIGKRTGYKIEYQIMEWDGMWAMLNDQRLDTVGEQISATDERREAYCLSEPYAYNIYSLLSRADNEELQSMDDLKDGMTISCETNTSDELIVEAIEKEYGVKLEPVYYDGMSVQEVALGRCDLWPRAKTSCITTLETVVLLTRKRKSKDYKVEIEIPIDVDGSKTYTEEKSTYQNIKKFIKAKYGVNTHTKDIAEVKRDCGVEMRLNYNISKKENPKIRHCTQEKRGYIMDALEHYQVI